MQISDDQEESINNGQNPQNCAGHPEAWKCLLKTASPPWAQPRGAQA